MKRAIAFSLLSLVISLSALAHGGHKHQYLGVVESLKGDDLVVVTRENETVTFKLTADTKFVRGTGKAEKSDLEPGTRVSVAVLNDGRTAVSIKIGASAPK